jgi:hypothetical protein
LKFIKTGTTRNHYALSRFGRKGALFRRTAALSTPGCGCGGRLRQNYPEESCNVRWSSITDTDEGNDRPDQNMLKATSRQTLIQWKNRPELSSFTNINSSNWHKASQHGANSPAREIKPPSMAACNDHVANTMKMASRFRKLLGSGVTLLGTV